jgi:hypothetical protein
MFVSVNRRNAKSYYSYDGINWNDGSTLNVETSSNVINYVVYGNEKFIETTAGSKIILFSVDGINWYPKDISLALQDSTVCSIAYGNDKFVILTSDGRAIYSYNGVTWYDTYDYLSLGDEDVTNRVKELINNGKDEVYVQSEEPVDAPDGAIWVDIDETSGGTLLSGSVPSVAVDDDGKMLQVVNGEYALVTIENSSIKTYIDNYINEALGGDY